MINLTAAVQFTETYRRYQNAHPAIREAMCLKAQYPAFLQPIEEGDLLAGRIDWGAVGFSPQEGWINLAYYVNREQLRSELQRPEIPALERQLIEELLAFWETECTAAKVRAAFTPELEAAIPTPDWPQGVPGIGFPIYRMLGGWLNFDKLVQLGLPGLRAEIEQALSRAANEDARALYTGMLLALEMVADCCRWYADQAASLAVTAPTGDRRRELNAMAEALRHISEARPETFHQGAQLAWLYALLSGHRNYGRLDVYLGDLYAADLAEGRIAEGGALAVLQSLWRLVAARKLIFDGRIVVGGAGRRNPENADRVALLAMEATRTVLATEPQLTLRFYRGQNPALMEKALTVIGEGRTYPLLYNDDVNVPAVAEAFDVSLDEAEHYLPFSCGEYALDHRSYHSPNGLINLLQALQAVLHNGRDPLTGRLMGLETGPVERFETFEQLLEAYQRQVEYAVEALADFHSLQNRIAGETAPFLLTSMLYEDCIPRGKGVFSGGVRYFGGTLESYGNINTADSLAAIRQVVYERKLISLPELVKVLDADFAGRPEVRRWLLDAPKYGNDNDVADGIAALVHEHVCQTIRRQRERTDLHSYLAVIINNSGNTVLGQVTAASPDGRRARSHMANANNPAPGADTNGVTALLNSLVKLDPSLHAGAVQNLKFSRELFTTRREQLEQLMETYWAQGGSQAMITVVSRGDLEAALREPEKYTHIFVRVGGFSARFVKLDPAVQQEVLSRTLH